MESCGCKQATAHAHVQSRCMWLSFEHTKNSNRSKNDFRKDDGKQFQKLPKSFQMVSGRMVKAYARLFRAVPSASRSCWWRIASLAWTAVVEALRVCFLQEAHQKIPGDTLNYPACQRFLADCCWSNGAVFGPTPYTCASGQAATRNPRTQSPKTPSLHRQFSSTSRGRHHT